MKTKSKGKRRPALFFEQNILDTDMHSLDNRPTCTSPTLDVNGNATSHVNSSDHVSPSGNAINDQTRQYRHATFLRYRKRKTKPWKVSLKKKRTPVKKKNGRKLLLAIPTAASLLPRVNNCPHCRALRFAHEVPTFCCSAGHVTLQPNRLPEPIVLLLTAETDNAKQFRACVRTYNNHLAFTSIGVRTDKELQQNYIGIYVFKVQGQIYHFLPSLNPGQKPISNLQIYFYDTDYEIASRMELCSNLHKDVLSVLLQILECNPYARFFRMLHSLPQLETKLIYLQGNPEVDQKVYNLPTVDQVSAILDIGETSNKVTKRSIRVFPHSADSRTISYYYGCYDPLQYPLLFPNGEVGWHQGIEKNGVLPKKKIIKIKGSTARSINPLLVSTADQLLDHEEAVLDDAREDDNFVSVREYYAYRFQIRPADRSYILHFGRLFHQYAVDMYIKLETQRLDFYKTQQDEIRREFLQGVADALSSGETEAANVGQRTILPASFIGSPRHMKRKYMDAMTLVQKFGKPDFFLTITANPNWLEIKEHLLPHEDSQTRPDLIVRVFHSKLEELKMELLEKHVLGEVCAYTYVIEYQKRGLPHAHFLLILKDRFKLYRPEEYDKLVSAELPNKDENPYLYDLVVRHMVHGPCGDLNPRNVCMKKKGICRSSYPKEFCESTTQSNDAYPIYRRRNNGSTAMVRGHLLDNRWVVPHCRYLIAKLDCHINVEICSSIKCVKYIYKYVYKGSDRILYRVSPDGSAEKIDEITDFQSARWISAPEALWRLYSFSLGEIKPAVIRLPLHLENYQSICFNKKQRLKNVLDDFHRQKTMLTEFFYMNSTSELAKELQCTYNQFPDHFVWLSTDRYWKPRERGNSVGRIVTAHPSEGERYYLRILLLNVRCPTSYNYLKIYDGKLASSFREAALNRGLLQDDNSQELCMQEASAFQMPYEMRRLFSTILVHSCPNNPKKLWLMFEDAMSEDYSKVPNLSKEEIKSKVLNQISSFLQEMGKEIIAYGICDNDFSPENMDDLYKEIYAEKTVAIPAADLYSIRNLNKEQTQIFRTIISRVYGNQPGSFFVDGPGGTGKTYLYRALLAEIRSKGYIALATASSGIAASILPGGRTAHSRFKIPIDLTDQGTCRISKQTALAELIKQSKLIIWDEAPMCKKNAIEALDDLLQDLMGTDCLFGGKVIVLGGDFRQTLPIVRNGTKLETIHQCLRSSYLWPNLERLRLVENMRARGDPEFTEYLLRVGEGLDQIEDSENIRLPENILLPYINEADSLKQLTSIVYPHLDQPSDNHNAFNNRAILTTKNTFVDEINEKLIAEFHGDSMEYLSYDEVLDSNNQGQYEDIINSLTPNGLPPHRLILKRNAPIILLRNISPNEGLCNGTRMICQHLGKHVIYAQISSGDFVGKKVFIHRIPLQPPNNEHYPVPYKRTQFPIRLCFAMTINKSQGQTLDSVGVFLKEPAFSHGQLYVALSRAKTSSCISVVIKPAFFDDDSKTRTANVVYKDILTL